MGAEERFTRILEHWFIREPALFSVLCSHRIVPNGNMKCPLRCGRLQVEYNPEFVDEMGDDALEEALGIEAVRILLKHPYERKPEQCCDQAIAAGSNVTIGDNYEKIKFQIDRPKDYSLKEGMPYEWYSRQIQLLLPPSEGGDGDEDGQKVPDGIGMSQEKYGDVQERLKKYSGRNQDLSELWDEDEMAVQMINGIIEKTTSWGSLTGKFAEKLQASTKASINWRKILSGFRASILSSERRLTRMRPNRRTGFQNMGSIRQFSTKVLVGVDVSGSITSRSLSYFFGVINSAFKYGFEAVDVVQFDCEIKTRILSLKKAMKGDIGVVGRGGTDFQDVIDLAHREGYDGLVILTDGYADEPDIPVGMRTRIIWVCEDKASYEEHHEWMEQSGRVCWLELK